MLKLLKNCTFFILIMAVTILVGNQLTLHSNPVTNSALTATQAMICMITLVSAGVIIAPLFTKKKISKNIIKEEI